MMDFTIHQLIIFYIAELFFVNGLLYKNVSFIEQDKRLKSCPQPRATFLLSSNKN